MKAGLFLYAFPMKASSSEITYAQENGVKTKLPNGDIMHVSRHPSSPDHQITVIARPGKHVMKAIVEHKPMAEITRQKKQEIGEAKAKADRSSAKQKANLEKKRKRSAEASNKQPKGVQPPKKGKPKK